MDGDPGDVGAGAFDLSSVDPGPDAEAIIAGAGDDLARAADRVGGAAEQGEDAVAGRLDHLAAVRLDGRSTRFEVTAQQLGPEPIAELCRSAAGLDDVGEQDRGEHAVGRLGRRIAGDEPLDDVGDQLDVEREQKRRIAGDLVQAGPRHEVSELPDGVDGDHPEVTGMKDERRRLNERKDITDVAHPRDPPEPQSLGRADRRLEVPSDPVGLDRIGGPGGSERLDHPVGPIGHIGKARDACVRQLVRRRGAAAHRRRDGDQPARPLRLCGREERERTCTVEGADQGRALGADRVHHRERVLGVGLEAEVAADRIGQSGTAAVVADDACELSQALEQPGRLGEFPHRLDVRSGADREQDQVTLARPVHLVGDRQLVTERIVGPRTSGRHRCSSNQSSCPPSRQAVLLNL